MSGLEAKVQFLIAKLKNLGRRFFKHPDFKTAHLEIKMASKAMNRSKSEIKNNFRPNSKHYKSIKLKLMFVFNPSSGRITILTLIGSATTCDFPAASGVMHNR
jgi:hypothetical protein